MEVIIVNDGSTEKESLNKLEHLANRGIKIIHQSNQGLAVARNYGAMEATGDFLAFLDADDMISTTYYSRAVEILQCKSNVSFVGCWVQYFGESKNQWPAFNPEPPYLLFHNMVNSSGLVYKRESFLKAGLNDTRFIYGMEDYDRIMHPYTLCAFVHIRYVSNWPLLMRSFYSLALPGDWLPRIRIYNCR